MRTTEFRAFWTRVSLWQSCRQSKFTPTFRPSHSKTDFFFSPEIKYTSPNAALTAVVARFGDEGAKASAYFAETLLDEKTRDSGEPGATALSLSFTTGEGWGSGPSGLSKKDDSTVGPTAWGIYELPPQELRAKRFNLGMKGAVRMDSQDIILRGN